MSSVLAVEKYRTRLETIEDRATYLQREIWNRRTELWAAAAPTSPIQSLEPGVGLRVRGYVAKTVPDLGEAWENGKHTKLAGVLDNANKIVKISAHLSNDARLFTAAHELGHAELHADQSMIFRDVPLSGPSFRRDWREREADFYAACFLMPRQLVRRLFFSSFGTEKLVLTAETARLLADVNLEKFKRSHRTPRDFSRAVAQATSFGGQKTQCLSSAFGVSSSTMAIRLEELGLVPCS